MPQIVDDLIVRTDERGELILVARGQKTRIDEEVKAKRPASLSFQYGFSAGHFVKRSCQILKLDGQHRAERQTAAIGQGYRSAQCRGSRGQGHNARSQSTGSGVLDQQRDPSKAIHIAFDLLADIDDSAIEFTDASSRYGDDAIAGDDPGGLRCAVGLNGLNDRAEIGVADHHAEFPLLGRRHQRGRGRG